LKKDENPEYFCVMLEYFYTGRININHTNAFGVLRLVDKFNVSRLKKKCFEQIKELITNENIFKVLEETKYYSYDDLYQYCKKYFDKNAKEMFSKDFFLEVSKETLLDLLNSDHIEVKELDIFLSIIEWGKFHLKEKFKNESKVFKNEIENEEMNKKLENLYDYTFNPEFIKEMKIYLADGNLETTK
jgi:hypothetical protein